MISWISLLNRACCRLKMPYKYGCLNFNRLAESKVAHTGQLLWTLFISGEDVESDKDKQ